MNSLGILNQLPDSCVREMIEPRIQSAMPLFSCMLGLNMRPIEIEAWVLRVIDQVTRKQHVEDSVVELKSTWPESAAGAARQIAAHANAARGASILWVIGVNEVNGVCGADPNELANWYPAVCAQFDQAPPALQDLNVRVGGQTVVALLFDTERAPFLVKNPAFGVTGGGPVKWEVPWREGRMTRTATREDLIRMLAPLISLPEIEWLDCTLTVRDENRPDGTERRWWLVGHLYVSPSGADTLVFPFHRCHVAVRLGSEPPVGPWSDFRLSPPSRFNFPGTAESSIRVDSLTVRSSSTEVLLNGPGQVTFSASATDSRFPEPEPDQASVTLTLHAIRASVPSTVAIDLRSAKPDRDHTKAKWSFPHETT